MNYEEMSDFEINKAVAIDRGGYCGHVEHMEHGVKEADRESNGLFYTERDYCNNPSDAWPIIVESKLSIVPTGGWWRARPEKSAWPEEFDDNPLRAAMIVFLMMNEKSNGNDG